MGLRDNFKQAARELMDGQVTTAEAVNIGSTAPAAEPAYAPAEERTFQFGDRIKSADVLIPTTVIAAGTVIKGSVQSEGDLELYGEVQGDVTCKKDLRLQGKLQGDASGCNLELMGIRMVGNVKASGNVVMDENSSVQGNIQAESMALNGSVQGDVQVNGRLSLEKRAVVNGKVTAGRLTVEEGAAINGEMSIGGGKPVKTDK